MERLQIPGQLLKNMDFHSEYCHKHVTQVFNKEVVKPVQMIIYDGQAVCPKCEALAETEKTRQIEQDKLDNDVLNEARNVLYRKSIVSDETILDATFENYAVAIEEERANKQAMIDYSSRLNAGEVFNIILQGNPGAGKSHLSYSLLVALNDGTKTCLFIDIDEMLRLIRDSFNNPNSQYTENYFIQLLSSVDYLVLDDLGAETGAIDAKEQAKNFVQRILRAVVNARQHKATITTTNLSGKQLMSMYDKKLVSRLMKNPEYIVFKEAKDKRIAKLPF